MWKLGSQDHEEGEAMGVVEVLAFEVILAPFSQSECKNQRRAMGEVGGLNIPVRVGPCPRHLNPGTAYAGRGCVGHMGTESRMADRSRSTSRSRSCLSDDNVDLRKE